MLDEEILELFVGHIDTHLLEAVPFKCLKAKYVEDPNLPLSYQFRSHRRQELVDPVHNPAEHSVVQCLCQRISCSYRGREGGKDEGMCWGREEQREEGKCLEIKPCPFLLPIQFLT